MSIRWLVGREGIEPPQSKTADLQSAELTTCSTYPRTALTLRDAVPRGEENDLRSFLFSWSRRRDSNPEPAVYKTAALPIELRRRRRGRIPHPRRSVQRRPMDLVRRRSTATLSVAGFARSGRLARQQLPIVLVGGRHGRCHPGRTRLGSHPIGDLRRQRDVFDGVWLADRGGLGERGSSVDRG